MPAPHELLLCYYGDDFTGSTDALEFLTRAGARAMLFIEPPTAERLARYPGLQAVGVAGMTRSMTPDTMEAVLDPALRALRALGAPHVHYKVCSTFDSSPQIGSIGRVIDLAAKIFGARFVPLLVGAPALGRHCVFGNLFARFGGDGEIFRLDRHPSMSKHPVTPSDESDLRLHLARQTSRRIALFDILKVDLPLPGAETALEAILHDGAEIVLLDVLYASQLKRLGALIDAHASRALPLFSVGSSGIEMELGAHWACEGQLTPMENFPVPHSAEPFLVVSGSCSPVTEKQIAWAREQGFSEVACIDAVTSGITADEIAKKVVLKLTVGRSVIMRTSKTNISTGTQEILGTPIGEILGMLVRKVLDRARVKRLCVAGGDTSGHVARALGIEALEMIAPLAPGAPLCRAHAPGSPADNLEVVFKGGQVGNADFFGAVMKGKI